jgi:hypothetical protein
VNCDAPVLQRLSVLAWGILSRIHTRQRRQVITVNYFSPASRSYCTGKSK